LVWCDVLCVWVMCGYMSGCVCVCVCVWCMCVGVCVCVIIINVQAGQKIGLREVVCSFGGEKKWEAPVGLACFKNQICLWLNRQSRKNCWRGELCNV